MNEIMISIVLFLFIAVVAGIIPLLFKKKLSPPNQCQENTANKELMPTEELNQTQFAWKTFWQIVLTIMACIFVVCVYNCDCRMEREALKLICWTIWALIFFFIHISKQTTKTRTPKIVSLIAIWSVPLIALISLVLFYDSSREILSPFAPLAYGYGLTRFVYYTYIKTKVYLAENENQ